MNNKNLMVIKISNDCLNMCAKFVAQTEAFLNEVVTEFGWYDELTRQVLLTYSLDCNSYQRFLRIAFEFNKMNRK